MQVALGYSGAKEGRALPMVLQIRVGSVDRGASVSAFSQYQKEVEYLWVPGSFLEQVVLSPAHPVKYRCNAREGPAVRPLVSANGI